MIRIATIITVLLTVTASTGELPADHIRVTLRSGRTYTAYVDQRTDARDLWLRFGNRSTRLLRPIAWEQVEGARYQGRDLSVTELQAAADELATAGAAHEEARRNAPSEIVPDGSQATHAERAGQALAPGGRIQSVSFDAVLANFDADAAPDGLLVSVIALGEHGQPIVAQGSLEVTVIAARRTAFNDVPSAGGQPLRQLGRWTRQIVTSIGPSAPVKLPFQNQHVERDSAWSAHALVHIRFVVPGQGVFEDSLDRVRVRQFAPTRDQLERATGRRQFGFERVDPRN